MPLEKDIGPIVLIQILEPAADVDLHLSADGA